MKRVLLLITSSHFGGAETLLYQTATRLDPNRFKVMVCSIKQLGSTARRLQAQGIQVESLNWDWKRDWWAPWKLLSASLKFKSFLKNFKPDILHASLFQADAMAALFGTSVPVRIATMHMVLRKRLLALWLESKLESCFTHFIAVSEDMRDVLSNQYGVDKNKISVIHNVVDMEETQVRSQEKLNITPPNFPWLSAVGRLDSQKGLSYLLEAVSKLKKRQIDAGLVLVGSGPDREKLEAASKRLGISDRVLFADFQANPMPFIANSRAYVMSSLEEGLPFSLLEAMAIGKPIIATKVGAIPEAIIDNENGLLVAPKDSNALALAIERLLTDTTLAPRLGIQARQTTKEKFTIPLAISKLETLYDSFFNS